MFRIRPFRLILAFVLIVVSEQLSCISRPKADYWNAEGYRIDGNYRKAIDLYSRALREKTGWTPAYVQRGNCYVQIGEYDSAIVDYTTALRLDPTQAMAYHDRGIAYLRTEQLELAANDFNDAYRRDSTYLNSLDQLAFVLLRQDRLDSAVVVMNHLIDNNPDEAYYYNNRGTLFKRLGRYTEAERDYFTFFAIDSVAGNDLVAEVHHSMAQLYNATGDRRQEHEHLELFLRFADPAEDTRVDSIVQVLKNW